MTMDFQKFSTGEELHAYTFLGSHPAERGFLFHDEVVHSKDYLKR